jgi:pimeloyl-ACP methyl ester carboxylesterase
MLRVPVESRIAVNGVEIALWEWPGQGRPVFFCHASGFHARVWDRVIAHLPRERRCFAFDARGHGRSSKPAPPYVWRNFGRDVAAIAESLGLSGAIGVGHSMGGHAVTLAAALNPSSFSALALFDPVIRGNDQYLGYWGKTEFVRKRRNQWASQQEMFERFQNRPPFDTWDRGVLRDYCEYGLEPAGDGYKLACPPEVEASVYENSSVPESNIYPEIATITIPVHVVRAGQYRDPANVMGSSPTAPGLAASFACGVDTLLPQHSHFIPMEAPELAAKLIANSLL